MNKICVLAGVVTFLAGAIFAQAEELPDHKLKEWEFGETWFGEKASSSKLRGKVVVIEYWGMR